MPIDLFGPADAGAVRAVTSRPLESADTVSVDSFFKNCDGGPGTGTPVTAWWLNRVTAALRSVVRRAGFIGSNADPDALAKAIRSQGMNFAPAASVGGSSSAITLTLDPAPADLASMAGTPLRFQAPSAATGATTVAVNGLGPAPLTWSDGSAISAGDWIAGEWLDLLGTGTSFVIVSASRRRIYDMTRASTRVASFIASGTFTVPANVTEVTAEVWGAGSGAWGAWGATNQGGGGGGGGGYARKAVTGLTAGQVIAVTVGLGGAGAAPGETPSAGGSSSFGPYVSATGGAINPASSGANPVNGNFGGTGTGGDVNITGSAGQSAQEGPSGVNNGGMGGGAAMGGGAQQSSFAGPGNGGIVPGGGASGGTSVAGTGYSGGDGARGLVIVRW